MKSPIADLRALLIADATLLGLLGGPKIYQFEPPQATERPLIMMYEVSGQPIGETLLGTVKPWERRISVDCQGATPTIADNIASRVITLLGNKSGAIGTLFFQHCRVISDVAIFEDTSRTCRRVVDFRTIYEPV